MWPTVFLSVLLDWMKKCRVYKWINEIVFLLYLSQRALISLAIQANQTAPSFQHQALRRQHFWFGSFHFSMRIWPILAGDCLLRWEYTRSLIHQIEYLNSEQNLISFKFNKNYNFYQCLTWFIALTGVSVLIHSGFNRPKTSRVSMSITWRLVTMTTRRRWFVSA